LSLVLYWQAGTSEHAQTGEAGSTVALEEEEDEEAAAAAVAEAEAALLAEEEAEAEEEEIPFDPIQVVGAQARHSNLT
jgi:hypothetical protein